MSYYLGHIETKQLFTYQVSILSSLLRASLTCSDHLSHLWLSYHLPLCPGLAVPPGSSLTGRLPDRKGASHVDGEAPGES